VSVINTATKIVSTNIGVGRAPLGVAVSPDGTRAYITNGEGTVSVINTATKTLIATVTGVGPNPYWAEVSPDGALVYVANNAASGTVTVISTATNSVTATIAVGANPLQVGFGPDGTAYVANCTTGSVSVIGATERLTAADLKTAGYSAAFLKKAGFAVADLQTAGYSVADLKTAGFTLTDL